MLSSRNKKCTGKVGHVKKSHCTFCTICTIGGESAEVQIVQCNFLENEAGDSRKSPAERRG